MREPYERIAGGPFRDDTHRAAVEATAVDLAGRPLAKLRTAIQGAKMYRTYDLHETPPWASQGDLRATRVEAEDGRVRAAQADADAAPFSVIAGLDNRMWDNAVGMAMMTLKGEWGGNPFAAIEAIWAASEAMMEAAGPLPLASTEPWVESDEAYRSRLVRAASNKVEQWTDPADVAFASGVRLDQYGSLMSDGYDDAGLPRGCLVQVTP